MKIPQYCSVCKAEYEMSVVPTSDGDDDGVVWLQCPSCKGFLPKVSSSADLKPRDADRDEGVPESPPEAPADAAQPPQRSDEPDAADAAEEPPQPDPLADMDVSLAVPYRPWETYAEGDIILHLAWDDYGVVVAKETLPGNRNVVQVRFAKAGTVRLIEQEGEGP